MFKLALRNLLRQKMRTLITLSAIVFGVVGLILSGGFVQDVYYKLGEALIHTQSGHLQIAKAGFYAQGSRKPEQYLMKDIPALRKELASIPGVADVVARLNFSGLVNNGRTDQAIVGEGIEVGGGSKVGASLVLSAGRQLKSEDRNGILIGQGVANALKLKPSDRATVLLNTPDGAMNTLDVEVVGVFQSVSKEYDARTVKLPLAAAQELMTTQGANSLIVLLQKTPDTEAIQRELKTRFEKRDLEVLNWIELNDFYAKTVQFYDNQFGVLRLIVLAMVLLSVVNSVNMSVMERVGEFGTLMALGNRRRDIFMLLLTENSLLGLVGATAGAFFGVVLALLITAIGIPMPSFPNSDIGYTAGIRLTPMVIFSAFFVGLLATVFASVLPARYVSRKLIVDSLRQNI